MEKKKKRFLDSVSVNEDIWFYPNAKSFDFVVWVTIDGKRKAAQFRILHSKIKKFID